MRERLDAANRELGKYGPNSLVPVDIKYEIEKALDELNDLSEVDCVFTGLCRVISQAPVSREVTEKDSFVEVGIGRNIGFWVTRFGKANKQYWGVGIGFKTDDILQDNDVMFIVQPRASYGIVPLHEVETAFPEGLNFLDNISGLLSHSSDGLRDYLLSPEFLQLPCEDQMKSIENALDAVRSECDENGFKIQNVPVGLYADRAYVWTKTDGIETFVEVPLEEPVKGTCVDLAVLAIHQLSMGRPIRSSNELCDSEGGIFLTVEPDAATRQTLDHADVQELYVPISGQTLNVLFDPQEIDLL